MSDETNTPVTPGKTTTEYKRTPPLCIVGLVTAIVSALAVFGVIPIERTESIIALLEKMIMFGFGLAGVSVGNYAISRGLAKKG